MLFTFALVFSLLVWLGIAASVFSVLTRPVQALPFCVYVYSDEEYGTGENAYYDVLMSKALEGGYIEDCLEQSNVPVEVWEKTEAKYLQQARAERIGEMAVFFVFFLYFGAFLFFMYAAMGLTMAYIRLNAVKLSITQHKALHSLYMKAAEKLGVSNVPPAYVIDGDGAANAFAVKIVRRRMVVFYAELVDRMLAEGKEDELLAVAAHELTHVKLRHIQFWLLLLPFNFIPFMTQALSRARELSADRGALFVTRDADVVCRALAKLVLGVRMTKHLQVEEYIAESAKERGFFATLSRLLSTHPPIPVRMRALRSA